VFLFGSDFWYGKNTLSYYRRTLGIDSNGIGANKRTVSTIRKKIQYTWRHLNRKKSKLCGELLFPDWYVCFLAKADSDRIIALLTLIVVFAFVDVYTS